MNEIMQRALHYMQARAEVNMNDPAKAHREFIRSYRIVALAAIPKPSVAQLESLRIYPGLEQMNLLQLRRGLESGSLLLEAVPEEIASVWRDEISAQGFKCELLPLDAAQEAAALIAAGLNP
jgi:hypothetical protein